MGVAAITNPWIFTVGDTSSPTARVDWGVRISKDLAVLTGSSSRSSSLPRSVFSHPAFNLSARWRVYLHALRPELFCATFMVRSLNVWSDMNNKPFALSTYTRGAFSSQHGPPELHLKGRWNGPNLILNDGGTLARAFVPDGSLIAHPGTPGPGKEITFAETDWLFGDPCPAHPHASRESPSGDPVDLRTRRNRVFVRVLPEGPGWNRIARLPESETFVSGFSLKRTPLPIRPLDVMPVHPGLSPRHHLRIHIGLPHENLGYHSRVAILVDRLGLTCLRSTIPRSVLADSYPPDWLCSGASIPYSRTRMTPELNSTTIVSPSTARVTVPTRTVCG